ncbi:MAG: DUF885 domain-containing protein [Candidatus Aenigmatarchaeota archaeon]
MNEDKKFDNLARKFFWTFVKRNPDFATYLGLHQFDAKMPNESKKRYLEEIKIFQKFLKEFKKVDYQKLSDERKIDLEAVIYFIELSLFKLKEIRHWEQNPDIASFLGDTLFPLFTRDFAPFEKRIKNIIAREKQFPKVIKQAKTRIKNPVKLWVELGIESCETLPSFLDEILKVAKEKKLNKKVLQQLEKVTLKSKKAIEDYKNYLKKILPKAKRKFAIGYKKFKKLIELRKLGMTPEEILEFGEKQLAELKNKLKILAEEIKPGATIEEVRKIIQQNHPETFNEILESYRKAIKISKEFVEEMDFATIPKNEELIVIETPAYMRHLIPFAAYFQPAKFEKKQTGIYIVTPPYTKDLGRYNYADINNTSVHEAYPGHHLQLACANTNPSLIRLLLNPTEFVEGWAHYCEEAMKELGYDNTPEGWFVLTQDMIWRAARIIVDVKLSTGKMSYEEAIDFLVKEVGMEKERARVEVNRYTLSPGYQLSYLLGKHLIKKLKEEIKEKMGNKFTHKFFHDTLLYSGNLPIFLMRKVFEQKIK